MHRADGPSRRTTTTCGRWPPTWSPRCTPPTASAWPRARSGWTWRCSSSTATTTTGERTVGVVCNPVRHAARGRGPEARRGRRGLPVAARRLRAVRPPGLATRRGHGTRRRAGAVQRGRAARALPPARDRPHPRHGLRRPALDPAGARSSRRPTTRPPTPIPPTGPPSPVLGASRPTATQAGLRRSTRRWTASAAGGDVAGDGGGGGDVEGVDARAHRDDGPAVGASAPSAPTARGPRSPRTRATLSTPATASSTGDGVVGQGQRDRREAARRRGPAGRRTSPAAGSTAS